MATLRLNEDSYKVDRGSPTAAPEEEGSAENPTTQRKDQYVGKVASLVQQGPRDVLQVWYKHFGMDYDAQEHVAGIYTASGIPDLLDRQERVLLALKSTVQKQVSDIGEQRGSSGQVRRVRHSIDTEDKEFEQGEKEAKVSNRLSAATPSHLDFPFIDSPTAPSTTTVASSSATSKVGQGWSRVQLFKTYDEALEFVLACQPFDYRPVADAAQPRHLSHKWPAFETRRESFEYAIELRPQPLEFISEGGDLTRKLRIRRRDTETFGAPTASTQNQQDRRSRLAFRTNRRMSGLAQVTRELESRPWVVECTGSLFQSRSPSSMRKEKREVRTKYFIAVPHDVENIILVEGYEVKQRYSIPCAGTPQLAIAAFSGRQAAEAAQATGSSAGAAVAAGVAAGDDGAVADSGFSAAAEAVFGGTKGGRPSVLAVNLPSDCGIDVIANGGGDGRFIIKCQKLPPSFLSRVRRTGWGN